MKDFIQAIVIASGEGLITPQRAKELANAAFADWENEGKN